MRWGAGSRNHYEPDTLFVLVLSMYAVLMWYRFFFFQITQSILSSFDDISMTIPQGQSQPLAHIKPLQQEQNNNKKKFAHSPTCILCGIIL